MNPTRFQLEEELSLSGKPMRVAGVAQYDAGDGKLITRYSLVGGPGGALVMQDEGSALSLLRPFPPAAPPVAEGSTVSVMGEKYALSGVRKLKVLGASGEPPAGTPKGPLLLSGVFDGRAGALLRELVPGSPAQSYFLVKPLPAGELLTGAEVAKLREAERIAVQVQAEADEGEPEPKRWVTFAGWAVVILVIGGLVYACSDDGGSSSSSSVRVGTGSFHGGK